MVEEALAIHLSKLDGELKFDMLVQYINKTNTPLKNRRLIGCLGLATLDSIYVDLDLLESTNSTELIFFIILHELGHSKRIKKYGKTHVVNKLSCGDVADIYDFLIEEEDVANRYAMYLYYKINGVNLPEHISDVLLIRNTTPYLSFARQLVGKIKTSDDYNNLMETYIVGES